MQKILVVGSGGAGKSRFSVRLGAALGIDVIHLDSVYWKPGWVETDKSEWQLKVRELVAKESWIMDGNYSGTLAQRLEGCDTVLFLDFPRTLCVWRVLKRAVFYFNTNRPELPRGCNERVNVQFLWWIWTYPARSRPKVVSLLEQYRSRKAVHVFTTQRQADQFLLSLTADSHRGRSAS